jgi:hypothetical protein
MGLEYILEYYGVPAEINRRVIVYGKPGIIVGASGPHIRVNLDDDPPGRDGPYHPTDGVEYLDIGVPRKVPRSRRRYLEYLRADSGLPFGEWLKNRA